MKTILPVAQFLFVLAALALALIGNTAAEALLLWFAIVISVIRDVFYQRDINS